MIKPISYAITERCHIHFLDDSVSYHLILIKKQSNEHIWIFLLKRAINVHSIATDDFRNNGRLPINFRNINMKTIIPILTLILLNFTNASLAADTTRGEEVFNSNCAGCHAGGKNMIAPNKSLSKTDLEKIQVNTTPAIINLVTNGKSPMPGFGKLGVINPADIENVAAYVLKKSAAGW